MEITINMDCSSTEILGVFNEKLHLLTYGYNEDNSQIFDCILIVSKKEYLKQWKYWMQGKEEYCQRYEHYCGVMGYVSAINPVLLGTQKINKWNKQKEDMDVVDVNVYEAKSFTHPPEFEHG